MDLPRLIYSPLHTSPREINRNIANQLPSRGPLPLKGEGAGE